MYNRHLRPLPTIASVPFFVARIIEEGSAAWKYYCTYFSASLQWDAPPFRINVLTDDDADWRTDGGHVGRLLCLVEVERKQKSTKPSPNPIRGPLEDRPFVRSVFSVGPAAIKVKFIPGFSIGDHRIVQVNTSSSSVLVQGTRNFSRATTTMANANGCVA